MRVLVLNAGSSSLKACIFEGGPAPVWTKRLEWTGQPPENLFDSLEVSSVDVAGHRVVHGGKKYRESAIVTPELKKTIASMAEYAPAHNCLELHGVEAMERILGPGVPQVAVFDTAFHASLPPAAYVYPGPYEWVDQGLRRYGFHGISHQYCSRRAAEILGRDARLVICHLGSGCSLSAVRGGRSVDTTMGFTPLDGLMMGTRPGSLDPGIFVHGLKHFGWTAEQLDDVLNHKSGLKGISGLSADMREIEKAMAAGHERAQLAFDIYVHRLKAAIAAMAASLGGMDALVFTAGIGENSSRVRAAACDGLAFLGVKVDLANNEHCVPDAGISAPESTARVLVIRTQEEQEISRECVRLVGQAVSPAQV